MEGNLSLGRGYLLQKREGEQMKELPEGEKTKGLSMSLVIYLDGAFRDSQL